MEITSATKPPVPDFREGVIFQQYIAFSSVRQGNSRGFPPPVSIQGRVRAPLRDAFGLCVGARFARPPAALRGGTLWGPSCGWDGGGRPLIRHGIRRDTFPPPGEGFGGGSESRPYGMPSAFARPCGTSQVREWQAGPASCVKAGTKTAGKTSVSPARVSG